MNQTEFEAAKKRFDTYDLRTATPSLSVDTAYEYQLAVKLRLERNTLLRATDYTQLADSTPDSNQWLAYRQSLRDLPSQAGFPFDVTFPSVPEPNVVGFEAFAYAGDGNRVQLGLTSSPIAISGYYPLYVLEEVANNAGDGTSHTHVFNNFTYYMPNGVTNYHGNYTGY